MKFFLFLLSVSLASARFLDGVRPFSPCETENEQVGDEVRFEIYYICINHKWLPQFCPKDTEFQRGRCRSTDDVPRPPLPGGGSEPETTVPPTTTTTECDMTICQPYITPAPEPEPEIECIPGIVATKPNPQFCGIYYVCLSGHWQQLVCPGRLNWNQKEQKCTEEASGKCLVGK